VRDFLATVTDSRVSAQVRHVKGSHIVVPRIHAEAHAYILQNADNRIVFVIPYEDRYSLIGTTDVPVASYEQPLISDEESYYLRSLANTYLARPLAASDIVWTYSGVRPLYDDGVSEAQAATRDYVLKVEGGGDVPAVLNIYGGKITTYRRLAEHAMHTWDVAVSVDPAAVVASGAIENCWKGIAVA